ncbi:MAG: hypothetical protein ACRDQD_01100 [Nocardioidaceae bacterium]
MGKTPTLETLWAEYVAARKAADDKRLLVARAVADELADGASELGLAKRLDCSRTVIRSMQGKRQRYAGRA